MTATRRLAGLTTLKWLGGFSGAVLVFILANRRVVTIASRFMWWELHQQWRFFVSMAIAIVLLPLLYLVLRLLRVSVLSPRLLFERYWHWSASVAAVVGVSLVLLLLPYVRKRYEYFSEAGFQMEALGYLRQNRLQDARSTCTAYLSLYPQRRVDGSWPDPVCAPILRFTDQYGYLAAYLKQRPAPEKQNREGIFLPVDFTVRGPAMTLTRELAGGRLASAEPSAARTRKPKEKTDTDE